MRKRETILEKALEKQRMEHSLAEIASSAGVSTKTLAAVRGDEVFKKINAAAGNYRKLSKLIGSLTRLSLFLGLDPYAVLKEYRIELTEPVKSAIGRVKRTEAHTEIVVPDPTLERISARAIANEEEVTTVYVGLLAWAPFYKSGEPADSFAGQYMTTLIKGLNPEWRIKFKLYKTIPEAISALVDSEPEVDLVFGLYDTPYRRREGLEFLPVPGIKVRLGAVASKGQPKLKWFDLLDPEAAFPRGQMPHVVGLGEEVGYHVMAGAAGYHEDHVRDLTYYHVPEMAADLILEHLKYGSARRVISVIDGFTARALLNVIPKRAEWKVYWKGGSAEPIPSEIPQFEFVEPDKWTPTFEVGIAVRGDSRRFHDLLEFTTRLELFQNALPKVGRIYAQLYSLVPHSERADLVFEAPISLPYSSYRWHLFAEAYEEAVLRVTSFNNPESAENLIPESIRSLKT